MVNEWTRADLPAVMDLVKASVDAVATDPSGGAYAALDAVVEHLNAHHPKPGRDFSGVERERDDLRRQVEDLHKRRRKHTDERAAWTRNRRELEAERDVAVARAEAAEARTAPAVTKAEVGKVVREALVLHGVAPERVTDTVWSLVSGADPAVFVVRESDVAAVEVVPYGDTWKADGRVHLTRNAAAARTDIRADAVVLARSLAVARAIEAGPDVDPVEDKSRELYALAHPGVFVPKGDDAELVPFRRLAAHALGQESDL